MKPFIKKIILFQFPVALCMGGLLIILLQIGELASEKGIVEFHNKKQGLIGLAYSDPTYKIKAQVTKMRNPEVLVLGTSRVLQFRNIFFKEDTRFYNAGRAISRIKDLRAFMREISPAKPKLIILGIDQYFFNANWDDMKNPPKSYSGNRSLATVIDMGRYFLKDFIKGKIDFHKIRSSAHMGLLGKMYNQGFRHDGSYLYGRILKNPASSEDWQFKDTFERIRGGNRRFQYAQNIHEKAIEELRYFLRYCQQKNINVIGFLPPFAHAVWEKLESKGESYRYLFQLDKRIRPVFTSFGYQFFNFSDIAWTMATDDELIDGFHGSEVAYLRILIKMGEQNRCLDPYIDLNRLKNMLASAYSPKQVLPDPLLYGFF